MKNSRGGTEETNIKWQAQMEEKKSEKGVVEAETVMEKKMENSQ